MWAKYDKKGDGVLDLKECMKYVKDTNKLYKLNQLKTAGKDNPDDKEMIEMIKSYDVNNNGKIPKNEMKKFM